MKKKILSLCLVVALAATAIIGGTLAYFTDTEQVTNTMVIGNVQINIDEFTYLDEDGDGNKEWGVFEDDEFVLYPIDNVQGDAINNKIVYTANTSPSKDDAYIRNIVLFEENTLLTDEYVGEADCCFPGLHFGYSNNNTTTSSVDNKVYTGSACEVLDETVTIGDKEYWVAVFTQKDGEAIPYDAALYSLSGVWMDKNITTEQIAGWQAKDKDGNVIDNKVDIIVFSQGIQAEGLTHEEAMKALGEVNETNLQNWIKTDDAVINDWTTKQ